ncbi:uncharacterized protein LOC8285779 [Ricinus communis]|uniref:Uncharacterized protein n=1 Tax=Ricinus communis TaxID=3988 RepID=B9T053_RICCO|nr:uncharacterized protein LOC8285779 [Ricinus communis]EEF30750.1 conserved hypothetical protein [Ricinus communis]|eukprot:XP_002531622.1 uncharacterized protein LOC8285779 [Ricinus communis]
MKQCAIQTSAFSTREEIRSSVSGTMSERRDPVVCPKPRRFGLFNASVNDHPVRSLRWHLSHQTEICESKAGNDLLDIILTKGGCYGVEQQSCTQVASSPPPFFCGSPPSRVANPLIQDARFGEEELSPISPLMPMPIQPPSSSSSSSPTSSGRKGGCVRANFGNKPAVRVEGFDCLDRDRRSCSIPALA